MAGSEDRHRAPVESRINGSLLPISNPQTHFTSLPRLIDWRHNNISLDQLFLDCHTSCDAVHRLRAAVVQICTDKPHRVRLKSLARFSFDESCLSEIVRPDPRQPSTPPTRSRIRDNPLRRDLSIGFRYCRRPSMRQQHSVACLARPRIVSM